MESEKYEFQIEGRTISITREEITTFYGPYYNLEKKDMDGYAWYMAKIKYYNIYTRNLDKSLVLRLIKEERLMKIGEADRFKLQLMFSWFVELKRENNNVFKYSLEVYCLDNPQSFSRKYITIEAALLHCLNGFNENASISNRYKSIEHYLCSEF